MFLCSTRRRDANTNLSSSGHLPRVSGGVRVGHAGCCLGNTATETRFQSKKLKNCPFYYSFFTLNMCVYNVCIHRVTHWTRDCQRSPSAKEFRAHTDRSIGKTEISHTSYTHIPLLKWKAVAEWSDHGRGELDGPSSNTVETRPFFKLSLSDQRNPHAAIQFCLRLQVHWRLQRCDMNLHRRSLKAFTCRAKLPNVLPCFHEHDFKGDMSWLVLPRFSEYISILMLVFNFLLY